MYRKGPARTLSGGAFLYVKKSVYRRFVVKFLSVVTEFLISSYGVKGSYGVKTSPHSLERKGDKLVKLFARGVSKLRSK